MRPREFDAVRHGRGDYSNKPIQASYSNKVARSAAQQRKIYVICRNTRMTWNSFPASTSYLRSRSFSRSFPGLEET